jgi:hypothetical protein
VGGRTQEVRERGRKSAGRCVRGVWLRRVQSCTTVGWW